jgi:hypothetical protein
MLGRDALDLRVRLARLERAGVVLLLVAALVPRARDLFGPFDRELEGFQGACFAAFAVNYERLGLMRFAGYPTFNIDLPSDPERSPYLYPNHPPLVPWLVWASAKCLGPEGWSEAWREGRAPQGVEWSMRLPFLALHLFGLWALWWAARQCGSAVLALCTLAIATVTPVSALYGTLINYENPCAPFLLLACGFHVRWLRRAAPAPGTPSGVDELGSEPRAQGAVPLGRTADRGAVAQAGSLALPGGSRRSLLAAAACTFAAGCVTFTPVFFLPGLVLHTSWHRGWRKALLEALVLSGAALLPLAIHAGWVRLALPRTASEGLWQRVEVMLGPLFDGSLPLGEWLRRQGLRLSYFFTWPILAAAAIGLALALLRIARGSRKTARAIEPSPSAARAGLDATTQHAEHALAEPHAGLDLPTPVGGASREPAEPRAISLSLPLLSGGTLMLLAFYRHTFDGAGARDGQTIYLLNLVPALALLAGTALSALHEPLLRLRGGIAPLVVLVGSLALPAIARTNQVRRDWREPGPLDPAPSTASVTSPPSPASHRGPPIPLPTTTGRSIAAILPAGAVGIVPKGLSLTTATSFYAWRTIVGADEASWGLAMQRIDAIFGLAGAPRYVLIPKRPPEAARATVAAARAICAANTSMISETEDWELWRSP